MDRTERALASFLDDDEQLETWEVDTINRGFELSPPGMGGSETLGVTDRRLLWLDEDLETVDREAILRVDYESFRQGSSSLLLVVGALALVVGVLATPVLWLFASLSTLETLAPLGAGIGLFVVASIASRVRDDAEDQGARFHYLEIRTERTTVQVYGEKSVLTEIRERIDPERV